MSREKLKFKKLLNEFRSLKYELEYVDAVAREGNEEFEIYYRQYCAEKQIDIDTLNKQHKARVESIFQKSSKNIEKAVEIKQIKEEFDSKDIFRQIAKKFHPDLIKDDDPKKKEYEEAFKQAADAVNNGKWGELFDVAEKYDIDLNNYDDINGSLKLDIQRIKKKIQSKKDSYGYLLMECEENKNCMDNVVKRFLKHLFNI